MVALGDSLIGLNASSDRLPSHDRRLSIGSGADAVIAFQEVPREEVVHYGIAQPRDGDGAADESSNWTTWSRKPSVEKAPSNLAVAARYVCRPNDLRLLQRDRRRERGRDPADRRLPAADPRRGPNARRPTGARTRNATTSATSRAISRPSSSPPWHDPQYGASVAEHMRQELLASETARRNSHGQCADPHIAPTPGPD